jgi:hypothetical protein
VRSLIPPFLYRVSAFMFLRTEADSDDGFAKAGVLNDQHSGRTVPDFPFSQSVGPTISEQVGVNVKMSET